MFVCSFCPLNKTKDKISGVFQLWTLKRGTFYVFKGLEPLEVNVIFGKEGRALFGDSHMKTEIITNIS